MRARFNASSTSLWVVGGVVVVAALAVGAVAVKNRPASAPTAQSTATVQRGTVTTTVSAAGSVAAVRTRTLSFRAAGEVSKVAVKPGDLVKAGQVLAQLDSADAQDAVSAAQDRVDSAQVTLDAAETAAGSNQAIAASNQAGALSQEGALNQAAALTITSPAATPTVPTSSAPTSSAPASSALGTARPTSSTPPASPRATPTRGSGGGTGGTGGTGGSGGTGGTGGGGSSGGSGGGSTQNRSGTGSDAILTAQKQLNEARLTLTQAERALAGTKITAPLAGKVLSVAGVVGSDVRADSAFIVLGGLTDLVVSAQFSEADVADLKLGQVATVTLPNRVGETFPGTVIEIDPVGTVSGRLVKYGVRVAFDKVPADLLIGQTAQAVIITGEATDVVYVASSAVIDSPAGTGSTADTTGTVRVREGSVTVTRSVEVGLRGDQYTEIKSGLSAGETVVIGG